MAGDTEYTIAEGKTFTYLPGANCVDEASSVMLKSFDGWYTEPGGNGKKLVTDPTVAEADPEKYVARITEDTTKFYAKWVDNRVQDDDYSSLIRWGTLSGGDVTNVGDTLVFHPQGAGNVSAHLSVDFSQNNNIGLPAGSVKITLPRKLFQGWDGTDKTIVNDVFDSFTVISETNDKDFVLVNSKEFQSTSLEPVYTVDPMLVKGGFTDENGIYQNYYKDSFEIKIEVKDNPNDPNSAFHEYQKRTLGVEFHTEVNTRIQKDQSTATLFADAAHHIFSILLHQRSGTGHLVSRIQQRFQQRHEDRYQASSQRSDCGRRMGGSNQRGYPQCRMEVGLCGAVQNHR